MTRLTTLLFAAFFACLPLGVLHADTTPAPTPSPRDVISQAIDQITQSINQNRDRLNKDPSYANQLVAQKLEGLVDFKRITRLVMGPWFDKASRDQKYRFLGVFKQSLIDTYASGVTLYTGQKITVLPLRDGDVQGDRAFVRMEMTTEHGSQVPVAYTMILNNGQWQVENVIVNGLNLGKTFRDQFAQTADTYHGDLDQTITHWAEQLKASQGLNKVTDTASQPAK